jgi:hypothetical protein
MKNIINTTDIKTVNFIGGRKGQFRVIVKSRGGFMITVDSRYNQDEYYSKNPASILSEYQKGAIQTIQFKAEGTDHWLTVFARSGKKVFFIDEDMLRNVTVGVINSFFLNTNLYNQNQYQAVNAKSWACMAYVMNEPELVMA